MSDAPDNFRQAEGRVDHAWIHERLAAALAGGLDEDERAQFDAHINGCAECFDAFTEARDADRQFQRAIAPLAAGKEFDEALVETIREKIMRKRMSPVVKRAGMAIAAAVALAASGVFAQYVVVKTPLTRPLADEVTADARSRGITLPFFFGGGQDGTAGVAFKMKEQGQLLKQFDAYAGPSAADNVRGIVESKVVYKDDIDAPAPEYAFNNSKMITAKNESAAPARIADQTEKIRQDGRIGAGQSGAGWGVGGGGNVGFADGHAEFDRETKLRSKQGAAPSVVPAPLDIFDEARGSRTQQQNFVSDFNGTVASNRAADSAYFKPADSVTKVFNVTDMSDQFDGDAVKPPTFNVAITADAAKGLGDKPLDTHGASQQTVEPFDVYMVPMANVATGVRDGGDKRNNDGNVLYHRDGPLAAAAGRGTNDPAALSPPAPQAVPTTAPAPATPDTEAVAPRKIIRNGVVEFEVRSFDDASATIAAVTTEEGGFVSSTSSDKLANGKIRGQVVVRVPPEHLDRLLLKLRALGDLKTQQIGASDVTKEYTDTESELRALRAMESRMIDLIKNGKGEVKDLVVAEKQLGEYRVQIEKLEGDIRYYNNLVGMATLTINAYEKDIQKPTAASEMENVALSVETEDVEGKYLAARKILDDARGRIVESELKKLDADQYDAHIVVDVPPDKADLVTAELRQLGKVANYTRDRKQTTSGGTGMPQVQVEEKDTHFTITLYNLANVAPRETALLTVAVRDVAGAYRRMLGLVRQPLAGAPEMKEKPAAPLSNGRVITSTINGQQPEQMVADIHADIRADQADAVIQAIRDSGEVLSSSTTENPDTSNVTSSKRGLQLHLVNIDAVPARETAVLTIAVQDVDKAYHDTLAMLQKPLAAVKEAKPGDAPKPDAIQQPAAPQAVGHVEASSINGEQPEQMVADIRGDIVADRAEAILQAIRSSGEVLASSSVQNPDKANSTAVKHGVQIRFINAAVVPAREVQVLHTVAASVPDAYRKLIDALQVQVAAGTVRMLGSQLNESDPRTVSASLSFEARREALPEVDKAFTNAGVDFLSRTITRSNDTSNTLDSKVKFQIDDLIAADALPPRSTTTLRIEVDDVEKSLESLRGVLGTSPVKEVEFDLAKDPEKGPVSGHLVVETPVGNAMAVLMHIKDLGGTEKVNQVVKNTQVPDAPFARERIDLTLVNHASLVESGKGVGATIRAALGSAAIALLWSLYLILTGVLFIGPFALIVWIIARLAKRRRGAPAA